MKDIVYESEVDIYEDCRIVDAATRINDGDALHHFIRSRVERARMCIEAEGGKSERLSQQCKHILCKIIQS
jgi:hypothetical protein